MAYYCPHPDYIYRRIRQALKSRQLKIKLYKMRHNGEQTGRLIRLEPRHDLLPTLIHETLHYLYPRWSETKVLRVERELCACLSPRRFKSLLKDLAEIM